jgi:hypothetical protein
MIRINDEVVWRAAPWVTERVLHELSEAIDDGDRPSSWPTSPSVDLDLQNLDPAAFRNLRRACAEALDLVFLAGPARFQRGEDFLEVVFDLSRLGLLLSLDPRASDAAGPEAAARDFVLVNAAAAFREERPSVAVLVLEAMPSKRGAAGLDRLRPAEREELVRVLRSLRQTRFAAAAGDDQALWSRITAATDRAIRDLRQAKDREGGDPGSEPW